MSLPDALQAAADAWISRRGGGRRQAAAALSARYRAGGSSAGVDLASYLVTRLPATYAAVSRVLGEVSRLRPDVSPDSLLDAGSGPGTASWAAVQTWPELRAVTFLDNHPAFLGLATELSRDGPPPLAQAAALNGRIEDLPDGLSADLVVAAYALAELPLARMRDTARGLWRASGKLLALVEPGTPQGFARLRACRDVLIGEGAVPVAPCTHALGCPMTGEDWCHFSVRLPRRRAHMHAKAASVPFEDERFSYLVLARDGAPPSGARILAPVRHAKPGLTFRLCAQGRVDDRLVARRDTAAYKQMRKLDWGDQASLPFREEDG